ncbi:MAG: glycogen debranching enzyme N-terminal domain-containing protein, partial [Bryobacteraceae bacterium]
MAIEAHPIRVEGDVCRDYGRSSRLEWLETNGTGGFAMGTVAGANARRYHGVLLASLFPPVNRVMLLSRLEEQAVLPDGVHELGCNQYPGVVQPCGFELLREFRLDPFPVWTWQIGAARIEKDLFLVPDRQAVVVRYRANQKCVLRARPFVAFRDYNSLTHANDAFSRAVEEQPRFIRMQPYTGMPSLTLNHGGANHGVARFEADGMWFYNFEYLIDRERGLDFREDLYTPGTLVFDLSPGETAWIAADLDDTRAYGDDAVREALEMRLAKQPGASSSAFVTRLTAAAEQFRAKRADGTPTIIAGYPWFTDWGRDTMISLPGLLMAR